MDRGRDGGSWGRAEKLTSGLTAAYTSRRVPLSDEIQLPPADKPLTPFPTPGRIEHREAWFQGLSFDFEDELVRDRRARKCTRAHLTCGDDCDALTGDDDGATKSTKCADALPTSRRVPSHVSLVLLLLSVRTGQPPASYSMCYWPPTLPPTKEPCPFRRLPLANRGENKIPWQAA